MQTLGIKITQNNTSSKKLEKKRNMQSPFPLDQPPTSMHFKELMCATRPAMFAACSKLPMTKNLSPNPELSDVSTFSS